MESGEQECECALISLIYIFKLVWATLIFGSGSGMLGPDRAICRNVMCVECKR